MTTFIQQLINGLMLGSVYALLALGYTMVYGIIKLINFAHGDIYMLGAYFGYFFIKVLHLNFFIALILAMAVSAIIGVVIEYIAYRPLRHSPRIAVLIFRHLFFARKWHDLFIWVRSTFISTGD
ncbi:MAG: hypothetical protein L0I43_03210 [Leuconostoc sp.]|nr:hypothetical protein [Leuconostoc sp.]